MEQRTRTSIGEVQVKTSRRHQQRMAKPGERTLAALRAKQSRDRQRLIVEQWQRRAIAAEAKVVRKQHALDQAQEHNQQLEGLVLEQQERLEILERSKQDLEGRLAALQQHQQQQLTVSQEVTLPSWMAQVICGSSATLKRWTGIDWIEYEILWQAIKEPLSELTVKGTRRIRVVSMELTDKQQVLLTLVWLRQYCVHHILAAIFGIDERHVTYFARRVLLAIRAGLHNVVWPSSAEFRQYLHDYSDLPDFMRGCVMAIDGSEIKVQRPSLWETQRTVWSVKKHQPALNVLVCCMLDGRIVYVSDVRTQGPHDQAHWRESGLRNAFVQSNGTCTPYGIIGDAGFTFNAASDLIQIHGCSPHRRSGHELSNQHKQENQQLSQRRVIIENVFARMKNWAVLGTKYRHWTPTGNFRIDPTLVVEGVAKLTELTRIAAPLRALNWRPQAKQ